MRIYLTILFFVASTLCAVAQDPARDTPEENRGNAAAPASVPNPSNDPTQLENTISTPATAPTAEDTEFQPGRSGSRMRIPAPVAMFGQDILLSSEETQANYISTETNFSTAYEDNIFASSGGDPISDVIFSIRPAFSWYKSTSRLRLRSFYAPRFMVYKDNPELNRTDQDLQLQLGYRLTPHVTVAVQDSFAKTE